MAWSDIQVSLVGFAGNTVTLSARNPLATSETARVGVTVTLAGGSSVTLKSQPLSFAPGETKEAQLTANSSISTVDDGPDPFPPA